MIAGSVRAGVSRWNTLVLLYCFRYKLRKGIQATVVRQAKFPDQLAAKSGQDSQLTPGNESRIIQVASQRCD